MYKSFNIKNFRCFNDLEFKPLERVNLIAGKNNVGKTALLEAIWMHHGYPYVFLCAAGLAALMFITASRVRDCPP